MNLPQTLAALAGAGTPQNMKIYGRHGVTGAMFGVSHAALKSLAKSIGTNHALACGLWATGNHDARVLACLVADPAALSARDLDAWVREIDNYLLCDAFSTLAARTGLGLGRFAVWKKRKGEYVSAAAWNLLCAATNNGDGAAIDDAFAVAAIGEIEAGIHQAANRTRHSMNQALICLGVLNEGLARQAKAAARRIGKVEVDHGQTSCQTPDAASYIDKTLAHRRELAARRAAGKSKAGRNV